MHDNFYHDSKEIWELTKIIMNSIRKFTWKSAQVYILKKIALNLQNSQLTYCHAGRIIFTVIS